MRSVGLSLRLKTFLLLVVVAFAPILVLVLGVFPRYSRAVRNAEERNQIAIISRLADAVDQHLVATVTDGKRLASAVGRASSFRGAEEGLAIPLITETLGSSESIAMARLEVPEAKIDTLLGKQGVDTSAAPASTPGLREEALSRGAAFEMLSASTGRLVVPIPRGPDDSQQGYLTIPVYLSHFRHEFEQIVAELQQSEGSGSVAVIDRQGALVVGYEAGLAPGAPAAELAVFKFNALHQQGSSVATAIEFSENDGTMLGTTRSIDRLGWTVAFWRPVDHALLEVEDTRRFALMVSLGTALAVILAAFVVARSLTAPMKRLVESVRAIGARDWRAIARPENRGDEVGALSLAIHTMATDLRTGEEELERATRLRADLSRFMSQAVVERIVRGEHPVELGGRRSDVTVLFADMVAFTSASEVRAPEQVVGMLNELFTVLTEVVFRHGGVVDKFIGDCLMAVWGAPIDDQAHAARAVAAAEDMMRFLEVGAEGWRERYGLEVRLAIGINSGSAVVGNIGSSKRMDYTVVGDVVNVAARLESIAAPNQVLVSDTTRQLAPSFRYRLLGERSLSGRAKTVDVHELGFDYD